MTRALTSPIRIPHAKWGIGAARDQASQHALPDPTEMRQASLRRDASYDGLFYVCVRTTGIFCRPSCPAKKPQPKNVAYRPSVRDCLLDGYRPCKRCRPLAAGGEAPDWLNRLLERVERAPSDRLTDGDLRAIGLSPHRVRRYFTKEFDMTFQAYHRTRRMGMALEQLRAGADPLNVAYDHGYESNSGFRDAFKKSFGATPGRSQALQCIKTVRLDSPVGPLVAGATDEGICLLEFADRRAFDHQTETLRHRLDAAMVPGENKYLTQLTEELREYFEGTRTRFTVPLIIAGTPFQEKIWNALLTIPHGQTRSYGQLAAQVGSPDAQRAVGKANGDNRIAILIPCHRVIRADGTLCGYGGGLWRKKFLLDLETGVRPLLSI